MKKGKFDGPMEKIAFVESLSRKLYAKQGYKIPDDLPRDYMGKSENPREIGIYQTVLFVVDELME